MKNETLKLALVIEEFDRNNESLPLELLKPIAETLRALAQRTWQGLTTDEIAVLHANYPNPQGFALALQAKLKEKNT